MELPGPKATACTSKTSDVSNGDASRPEQDAGAYDGPLFCTGNVAPALHVRFAKPPIACDEVSIVDTDVGYTDTLRCLDFDGDHCECYGADERPGTYQLTASIGNPPIELARSGPITAGATPCHVVTQTVTLQLSPLPTDAGVVTPPDAGGVPDADAAPQ